MKEKITVLVITNIFVFLNNNNNVVEKIHNQHNNKVQWVSHCYIIDYVNAIYITDNYGFYIERIKLEIMRRYGVIWSEFNKLL